MGIQVIYFNNHNKYNYCNYNYFNNYNYFDNKLLNKINFGPVFVFENEKEVT